jgi:hypothetical protein
MSFTGKKRKRRGRMSSDDVTTWRQKTQNTLLVDNKDTCPAHVKIMRDQIVMQLKYRCLLCNGIGHLPSQCGTRWMLDKTFKTNPCQKLLWSINKSYRAKPSKNGGEMQKNAEMPVDLDLKYEVLILNELKLLK